MSGDGDGNAGHAERLANALLQAGLPRSAALLGPPPEPGTQPPRDGPWAVVPFEDRYVVGAMGRGQFAEYDTVAAFDAAVDLVIRVLTEPAAHREAGDSGELAQRGRRTGVKVVERTGTRGCAAGTAMLEPGDALDVIGPETGHHLYALGTPFQNRSQPPTDVGAPYHRYDVLEALPDAVEGICAPWFEQPGGGAMVVLQHPIRWYVDQGHLVDLVDGADEE